MTPKPSTETTGQPGETAREKYLKEIAANPKWKDTTRAGSGFMVGGAKPSGMTRDAHMNKLSRDSRFEIVKPSGKGFVIPGAKRPSKRAAGDD